MSNEDIKFGADARERMLRGVDILPSRLPGENVDAAKHSFTRVGTEFDVLG